MEANATITTLRDVELIMEECVHYISLGYNNNIDACDLNLADIYNAVTKHECIDVTRSTRKPYAAFHVRYIKPCRISNLRL